MFLDGIDKDGDEKKPQKNKAVLEGIFFGFAGWSSPVVDSGTTQKQVSRCCNSEQDLMCDRIAGILEGFGLLNQNADQKIIPGDVANVLAILFPQNADGQVNAAETAKVLTSENVISAIQSGDLKAIEKAVNEAIASQGAGTVAEMPAVSAAGDAIANQGGEGLNAGTQMPAAKAGSAATEQGMPQVQPLASADGNAAVASIYEKIAQEINALNAKKQAGTNGENQLSETARMPEANQFGSVEQDARTRIKELLAEYLCSFENTSKGAQQERKLKIQNGNVPMDDGKQVNHDRQTMESSPVVEEINPLFQDAAAKRDVHKTSGQDGQKADDSLTVNQTLTAAPQEQGKVTTPQKGSDVSGLMNTKAPTPEDMAENIARIVDKISSNIKEGQQEFEISLKPENLGKLKINLLMESDGIKAHIKTADLSVKGLISNELPVLQDYLKEKGLHVTSMEVAYEAAAYSEQQSQGHQHFNGNSKNRRYSVNSDIAVFEPISEAMTAQELLARNSSVEFRA